MSSLIGNKPHQVPTNSDLGRFAFMDYLGMEDFGSSVPTISSITDGIITISSKVTFINVESNPDIPVISAINVPGEFVNGGQIVLIPKQSFTTNTTINIAVATTAEVNRPLTLVYEAVSQKWYPNYVNNSVYTTNKLSSFSLTSSNELASIISDETGSGKLVFGTSPTITTSLITGSASFDLINTNATTVNFAGTATTINIGSTASGSVVNCKNDITALGNITAYSASDKRLKENITPIENPLDKLLKLSGNTFKWTDEYYATQNQSLVKQFDIGVIAQEVQEVLPEAVNERDNGMLAVDYQKLVPLLIECIKEQQKQINELKGTN